MKLDQLIKIAESIKNLQIIVGNSPIVPESLYHDIIKNQSDVTLAGKAIYPLMKYSDFLIVASGTATLECAFLETPMIIVYNRYTSQATVLWEWIKQSLKRKAVPDCSS